MFEEVDGFPIGLEEAKEMRLELMEERNAHALDLLEDLEIEIFFLCEH